MRQHYYFPKPGFDRYVAMPESCGRYFEEPDHAERRESGYLGYYNLHLLFGGKGEVTYEGRQAELQAGNGFLYAPREAQQYRTRADEPWDVYWVHFYGKGIEGLLEERGKGEPWLFTFGSAAKVKQLLDTLLGLSDKYESGNETKVSAVLYELLALLLQGTEGLSASPGLDYRDRIRRTADLVAGRCEEAWPLERMASETGYSPPYFCRLFQRAMGLTPAGYLQEARLARAKRLLVTSGLSVKRIATETGYSQSSYFILRFRESEGMTPEQYRRLYALR